MLCCDNHATPKMLNVKSRNPPDFIYPSRKISIFFLVYEAFKIN